MDSMKYYDFLKHGVDYGGTGYNANACGMVTNDNLPFFHVWDAVEHVVRKSPDIDYTHDKPVRRDIEQCKALVRNLNPELERLMDLIEINLGKRQKELNSLVELHNKLSDSDLLEHVRKAVLHDEIVRKGGEFSGVIWASQLIRKRILEFINITSMKGG